MSEIADFLLPLLLVHLPQRQNLIPGTGLTAVAMIDLIHPWQTYGDQELPMLIGITLPLSSLKIDT